jgi:hypothetical protein
VTKNYFNVGLTPKDSPKVAVRSSINPSRTARHTSISSTHQMPITPHTLKILHFLATYTAQIHLLRWANGPIWCNTGKQEDYSKVRKTQWQHFIIHSKRKESVQALMSPISHRIFHCRRLFPWQPLSTRSTRWQKGQRTFSCRSQTKFSLWSSEKTWHLKTKWCFLTNKKQWVLLLHLHNQPRSTIYRRAIEAQLIKRRYRK